MEEDEIERIRIANPGIYGDDHPLVLALRKQAFERMEREEYFKSLKPQLEYEEVPSLSPIASKALALSRMIALNKSGTAQDRDTNQERFMLMSKLNNGEISHADFEIFYRSLK